MAALTKTEPPATKNGRRAQLGKLVATAKGVKSTAQGAVESIA